jgi:hypothetical protein
MIRTLSFNPFISIQIAAIMQTIIVASYIFIKKDREQEIPHRMNSLVKIFLKQLVAGIFCFGGIFLFDTAFMWIIGGWGWQDWRYQLPSVILLLIVGIEYVWVSMFSGKFNWINFSYVISVFITYEVIMRWYIPTIDVMSLRISRVFLPLILISIGVYWLISLGRLVNNIVKGHKENKIKNTKEEQRFEFWYLNFIEKKIFSRWLNIIVWILSLIQAMLVFNGYSLFSFWYFPN